MSAGIYVWFNDSSNVSVVIPGNFSNSRGLFVSTSGDIYVDNGYLNGQVVKCSLNGNSCVSEMYVGQQCYGLFIDANDTLYCSMTGFHQIVTQPLNSDSNIIKVIAGTGCPGSMSNQLNSPYGMFVDTNFDLYVADYTNNRIQFFQSGQLNATTVAGNGSSSITVSLNSPTAITLDADGYLFIVDKSNNRIVRSGPNGFQCLVGCTCVAGSASNQMNGPQILSFDTDGNMFVSDWVNNRVQKFLIATNSCGQYESFYPYTQSF
jgi:tripartite motif-containing protein 71